MSKLAESLQRFAGSIEHRFDKVNDDIDKVLTLLCNVDKRLSDSFESHERRIRRLEKHVGFVAS